MSGFVRRSWRGGRCGEDLTDRIEALVPMPSAEEISAGLAEKLKRFLLWNEVIMELSLGVSARDRLYKIR